MKTKKTLDSLLQDNLCEELYIEAVKETENQQKKDRLKRCRYSIREALMDLFTWTRYKIRYNYWCTINQMLRHEKYN